MRNEQVKFVTEQQSIALKSEVQLPHPEINTKSYLDLRSLKFWPSLSAFNSTPKQTHFQILTPQTRILSRQNKNTPLYPTYNLLQFKS